MKFQCLLLSASLAAAESGFLASFLGTQTTRLGLEPSSGFLRSSQKARSRLVDEEPRRAPRAADARAAARRAVAADGGAAADAVVLVQQEAKLTKAGVKADVSADLLSAKKKLEERPVEPAGSGANATDNETAPRNAATKKWSEIKTAQDEAKKAAAEGADLLKDDSVKHLMSWEAMLISNVATGDDEHAQPCIAHCRYGEKVRHSWQECVERCVEDGMTRRMLLVGLPESERAAAPVSAPAPAGIDDLKKKRTARRRARSEDL